MRGACPPASPGAAYGSHLDPVHPRASPFFDGVQACSQGLQGDESNSSGHGQGDESVNHLSHSGGGTSAPRTPTLYLTDQGHAIPPPPCVTDHRDRHPLGGGWLNHKTGGRVLGLPPDHANPIRVKRHYCSNYYMSNIDRRTSHSLTGVNSV